MCNWLCKELIILKWQELCTKFRYQTLHPEQLNVSNSVLDSDKSLFRGKNFWYLKSSIPYFSEGQYLDNFILISLVETKGYGLHKECMSPSIYNQSILSLEKVLELFHCGENILFIDHNLFHSGLLAFGCLGQRFGIVVPSWSIISNHHCTTVAHKTGQLTVMSSIQ